MCMKILIELFFVSHKNDSRTKGHKDVGLPVPVHKYAYVATLFKIKNSYRYYSITVLTTNYQILKIVYP